MSGAGVVRISLNELDVNISNSLIVGLIISKRGWKQFSTTSYPKSQRAVWGFTLRDSVRHFINVTCWGSVHYIKMLNDSFHVGDVVDVIRTQIKGRKPGDRNEQYVPEVTSPFSLTFNEGQSEMAIHDGGDYSEYHKLLKLPTKSLSGIYTLTDVVNNANQMKGLFIDILVGIRTIGPVKTVITKDKRTVEARDIIIMDQHKSGISITLWEKELIDMANHWEPRKTVLFIVDARVHISKEPTLVFTSRTLITMDPELRESECLMHYMKNAPTLPMAVCKADKPLPNVNTIHNVVSLAHINQRYLTFINDTSLDQQFTAIVYCFVTEMDLSKCLTTRCALCDARIDSQVGICFNLECPAGSGTEQVGPVNIFELKIGLSDHTSSLRNVDLSGQAAVDILGVTPSEFENLSEMQERTIKWKILLERCEVKLLLTRGKEGKPTIRMLSCTTADICQVAGKLPLF